MKGSLKDNEYISPVIVAVCFCIGYVIKSSLYFIDNRYIPVIVAIVGMIISIWQDGINPKSIAIGLVSGLASTGAFELIRNISEAFNWIVFHTNFSQRCVSVKTLS